MHSHLLQRGSAAALRPKRTMGMSGSNLCCMYGSTSSSVASWWDRTRASDTQAHMARSRWRRPVHRGNTCGSITPTRARCPCDAHTASAAKSGWRWRTGQWRMASAPTDTIPRQQTRRRAPVTAPWVVSPQGRRRDRASARMHSPTAPCKHTPADTCARRGCGLDGPAVHDPGVALGLEARSHESSLPGTPVVEEARHAHDTPAGVLRRRELLLLVFRLPLPLAPVPGAPRRPPPAARRPTLFPPRPLLEVRGQFFGRHLHPRVILWPILFSPSPPTAAPFGHDGAPPAWRRPRRCGIQGGAARRGGLRGRPATCETSRACADTGHASTHAHLAPVACTQGRARRKARAGHSVVRLHTYWLSVWIAPSVTGN